MRTARRSWALAAAVVAAAGWAGWGPYVPWLTPVVGLWLAVLLPVRLLAGTVDRRTTKPVERILLALAGTVAGLLVLGLTANALLPLVGVDRPLDRVPVTLTVAAGVLGLVWWRGRVAVPHRSTVDRPRGVDVAAVAAGGLVLLLTVMGANRLNNGLSGAVTVVALVVAVGVVVLLFARRDSLSPSAVAATIYLLGLALLLMTSLRGWYVTGHDIQREYRVFELTKVNGNWQMSRFRDAYNACLSITLLPTMLQRLVGVSDPYVYKVFFQLLFAACPVMVHQVALRFTGRAVALLAAVYFMAFPTYFTDMPFLNRQEVAFLMVGALVLVVGNAAMPVRQRRVWVLVFAVGMVLSHYSTTYITCAVLLLGWLLRRCAPVLRRALPPVGVLRRLRRPEGAVRRVAVLNLAVVAVIVLLTVGWNGAITATGGGLVGTLTRAGESLAGTGHAQSSSDVKYSLLAPAQPTAQERLASYRQTIDDDIRAGDPGDYYASSTVDEYRTDVAQAVNLPPTRLGAALGDVGIDAAWLNTITRQGAAKVLQLFVLIGLVSALVGARRLRMGAESVALGWAAFAVILLQVMLPGVSADYGVLRTFQQGMFLFAPALAFGSVAAFGFVRGRWRQRAALGVAVAFQLSLTGVVPQLLGAYPAQLHLNNAGQYYDLYYLHPEEIDAISWLQDNTDVSRGGGVQSEVQTDRYTFTRLAAYSGISAWDDIYPALVRKNSYVFLGYSATRKGQSTVSYEGDLITYRYPMEFLWDNKSRIYSSAGAQIYR